MATELEIIKLSEIETKQVEWLWYPYIPYGKLTMIQGDPGGWKNHAYFTSCWFIIIWAIITI